ncbi:MAG: hypothetical protein IJR51_03865, partial [Clostridia bacterium]|nr:hypothetical protein [Clostridia bacterium]
RTIYRNTNWGCKLGAEREKIVVSSGQTLRERIAVAGFFKKNRAAMHPGPEIGGFKESRW